MCVLAIRPFPYAARSLRMRPNHHRSSNLGYAYGRAYPHSGRVPAPRLSLFCSREIANTGLRSSSGGAITVLAITGLMSLGWMTVVNFLLRSDFKWALVALDLVWALGLVLAVAARLAG